MTHECPAPNCEKNVTDRYLACPPHWFALPADLRRDINNEYDHHGESARLRVLQGEAFAFWTEHAA